MLPFRLFFILCKACLQAKTKDGVYVVPLDAWKIKNRRRQNFGMGHNLKTSTKTKDKFIQESRIFNDYKKNNKKSFANSKKIDKFAVMIATSG